jgi:hAT family C-terminal dimerisation region
MARDVLSIPASGAGVERLFNSARDICHYRRGHLKPDTIKDLMLHLFSSKFELEQSELEMVKEYLSAGEAAMLDQMRKPILSLDHLDPISDDEEEDNQEEDESENESEDDQEDDQEDELSPVQPATQRKQAQRKRPRSRTSEALDNIDDALPLPEMPTEESTQARSGRIRKKPKLPKGFEIDKL